MNKTLLKQSLQFNKNTPRYSSVTKLYKTACAYQDEHSCYFINGKYRGRVEILDVEIFFQFVSEEIIGNNVRVSSFEEIEEILYIDNRKDNILFANDSKNSVVRVFDLTVVYQNGLCEPTIYKSIKNIPCDNNKPILAVENANSFLDIEDIAKEYNYMQIVYLGGYGNTLTREFLKDKEVVFFVDYDIEGIRIFNSFKCKSKKLFKHSKVEEYFSDRIGLNEELYRKQLSRLEGIESNIEYDWLLHLIKSNNGVLEQEIFV